MNDFTGDPWQKAIENQQNGDRNSLLQQDLDAQRSILADSENAATRDAQSEANKNLFMRRLMGTIIKRSGGMPITPRLANWANVALQKSGVKDMGIMAGGGLGQDGNFIIPTFSGVDQGGRPVASEGIKYGHESVFSMMNQLRGIFSDSDRKVMADRLRENGVGEETISSMSYNPFATMQTASEQAGIGKPRRSLDPDHIKNRMGGDAGGRQIGNTAVMKSVDLSPKGVSFFASDGKGGFSESVSGPELGPNGEYGTASRDYGTRDPNRMGQWKVTSSGPSDTFDGKKDKSQVRVYENDKTGEVVRVKDGENLRDVLAMSEKKGREGVGLEIAHINADQKEKEREARSARSERDSEFREKKFQYGVGKDMAKEANEFLSSLSDVDKEAFKKKYPEMAKSILGMNEDDGAGKEQKTEFKEGDEQDVNGVRMKLLPSKKNPGKLTWQRI